MMILLGIGANLPSFQHAEPRETCEAALAALARHGVVVAARSRWWRSAPVPISDQPWYINGIAVLETALAPDRLLDILHQVEAEFGRRRGAINAARALDLDLLAYHDLVTDGDPTASPPFPCLPHPRLAERAFVLLPLAEVAPAWHHPLRGLGVAELVALLPTGQAIEPVEQTNALPFGGAANI